MNGVPAKRSVSAGAFLLFLCIIEAGFQTGCFCCCGVLPRRALPNFEGQCQSTPLDGGTATVTTFSASSGSAPTLVNPTGIASDGQDSFFVADTGNNRICRIDAAGTISVYAGGAQNPTSGNFLDGPGDIAEFAAPSAVAVDGQGIVYVADTGNNRIRKIDTFGNVTTLAGNGAGAGVGEGAFADGTGGPNGSAEFFNPSGVAVDALGNVYVADTGNGCVRKIDLDGNVITLGLSWAVPPRFDGGPDDAGDRGGDGGYDDAGMNDDAGTVPDAGAMTGGAGFQGELTLSRPVGIAIDARGNLYVTEDRALEEQGARIDKADPAGTLTLLAGVAPMRDFGSGFEDGAGGADGEAIFDNPTGLAVDPQGNVFVADNGNNRIRRIDTFSTVTTLAGAAPDGGFVNGTGGCDGTAQFLFPAGVALDAAGNIFVTDSGNNVVRRITP